MLERSEPVRLGSYLAGRWQEGAGEGSLVHDAATGRPVARLGTSGIDMQAALRYGREVGSPALRALRIHQRALMMKEIGLKLLELKEEFYELSYATGATRSDSWVDIEGGIGTLLSYASLGRRELPNGHVIPDGKPEILSKDGSFIGQHVFTSMQGVAIHINAFNFPVWGMLEKLAPTWLAGMPAIVKPASQTAYLTERVVRRILEIGVLPEGALQLICGSTGDLLDHVTCQDVVTFTGSAATARKLRRTPAIIENSVRFTAEADSLNASILAPDAAPGTEEFDLYIKEVHREMTAKAGQKCTAIRRAIVPAAHLGAVVDALRARIEKTVIGDPSDKDTRMGPLASMDQLADVRQAVRALAGEADIVIGDPETCPIEGGAFMAPCVLVCKDPLTATVSHEVEAFGPVCTLMPYESLEDAIAIANRGSGSLVASIFTNDAENARTLGLGIARLHGRVMLGNRASAKNLDRSRLAAAATRPWRPGPGRRRRGAWAGIRSVFHFMQRTALQGTPDLITAIAGKWMPGATRNTQGPHPFRKSLAELEIGDTIVTGSRVVTLEDIEHFAEFTGDTFYAHMDEEAAKRNPFFDGRVAHGYLIVSFAAGLFVQPDEGPVLANYGRRQPSLHGPGLSRQRPSGAADGEADRRARERGITARSAGTATVTRDGGEVVAQYDVLTMVAKTWPQA